MKGGIFCIIGSDGIIPKKFNIAKMKDNLSGKYGIVLGRETIKK